ncbi:glutamate synthase-related protein [Desulfuribacillus alkaliarsenatis]|nr:glutamate synthase-related protein [Desulfuribacillus alkaliarsenatis]
MTREHDSCGIFATVEKDGQPKRHNVERTIDSLIKMEHRAGFIDGEGDGCGVLTDIPRKIWAEYLEKDGRDPKIAEDKSFFVAHILIPKSLGEHCEWVKDQVRSFLYEAGIRIYVDIIGNVVHDALGPMAKAEEPVFWQLGCQIRKRESASRDVASNLTAFEMDKLLFDILVKIENLTPVHVASMSRYSVIYKVMGAASVLPEYYPDLKNPNFGSVVTIGHNRYSTNTLSTFERVQPFSLLGHNGELNTISRLREEGKMLGIPMIKDASDSQDLNRTIEALICKYDFSLFEAMELVFPPIAYEIKRFDEKLQDLYAYYRQLLGPYAQGPAGIVSRHRNQCVFAVDALGLRPLWFIDAEDAYFFSSEQGVIPLETMVSDPAPLAPGEKVAIELQYTADNRETNGTTLYRYSDYQQQVYQLAREKCNFDGYSKYVHFTSERSYCDSDDDIVEQLTKRNIKFSDDTDGQRLMQAFAWDTDDIQLASQMQLTGTEAVRSMGFDGPLACLSKDKQNLADYMKESVAVVTNPAIDREREMEHFSTRVILGYRPTMNSQESADFKRVEIRSPILLGGERNGLPVERGQYRHIAEKLHTYMIEDLILEFPENKVHVFQTTYAGEETMLDGVRRIRRDVIEAVENGAELIIFDDTQAFKQGQKWIDPLVILSAVDIQLKRHFDNAGVNLRRKCSLILRSGGIRNLHDFMMAMGLGADAINPYLLLEFVGSEEPRKSIRNLYTGLQKGIEKVLSTLGIHELRGYARLFSSVGLKPEVIKYLGVRNFSASEKAGLGFKEMDKDMEERLATFASEDKPQLAKVFHYYPKIWKVAAKAARGEGSYGEFLEKLENLEKENPISLRHTWDLKLTDTSEEVTTENVNISAGKHRLPFVISSMSFGSQNEVAFRAYAEAADRLDMISLNGEGGEIPDMLGKYRKTRGKQIASGRFGVNINLMNSSDLIEIKIGQGAKPGEGGHLPGSKVSEKVAEARNATPGVDLISPSNHHDIYSIEDLAQIIEEVKVANSEAKVIVKVPVVPNIGTIAVGIAKAGADIIKISGYDGGTGAARAHALRHVGLPTEIGVKYAHDALLDAGLRQRVEIWADGGLKSGLDAVKMMLLGANRSGFGTMAMVAVGCTSCRGCHKGTCHVGITTQVETVEEAQRKGLKVFNPRNLQEAVASLCTLFEYLGMELRELTARLGFTNVQDLVGRSDLLEQVRELDRVDCSDLLKPYTIDAERAALLKSVSVNWYKSTTLLNELTKKIAHDVTKLALNGETNVVKNYGFVPSEERCVGTRLAGSIARGNFDNRFKNLESTELRFANGSILGNGVAAFNQNKVGIYTEGGAQDGVGKMALGGKVIILKGKNKFGQRVNGSVGKGFAYGAQAGLFIVQGDADSRAGIRLSGADVIIGGELKQPINDELGAVGTRANIKGFAFEYMTNGRAIVLGDPGPWMCSGMTGGVVYVKLSPELGLDEAAIQARIARGAKVALAKLDEKGVRDVEQLLTKYKEVLLESGQKEEALNIEDILEECEGQFIQIFPKSQQADQTLATE